MTNFEVKTATFKGPMETLLGLIEKEELAITEVSLAAVTDAFLSHLERLRQELQQEAQELSSNAIRERLALIAGFLVVASRLILLKSRTLLPHLDLSDEEEEDIGDLKHRLEIYKRIKLAGGHIVDLWEGREASLARPYFMESHGIGEVFYPDQGLTVGTLHTSIDSLHGLLQRFIQEEESLEGEVVSLEEKIAHVRLRLETVAEESLKSLSQKATRAEAVALFLAVLHLAREQLVLLEQSEHFSDIIIRKQQ